jgi:cytochrome P450
VTEGLCYDPYDYGIHEDPYPVYARLRREAPLYFNESRGFWALSRHADVSAGFRNSAQLSNRFGVTLDPAAYGPEAHRTMSFLAMDPPRHTRMRALVSKGFTPSRVADLEQRVAGIADGHLSAALEKGTFDFVSDFAGLVPMDVISELLGVPSGDRRELRQLADLLVERQEGSTDVPTEGVKAAFSLIEYFSEMIDGRRSCPHEDLTSALTVAEIEGDRLTDDEITAFLILMIVAGNETTTKLLANAWYWGWRFPDVQQAVLSVPARSRAWVEETLRYDTSTQMLVRVASGGLELLGTPIPDDSPVLLLLGSANRDEEVFADPDRFELGRDTAKLISFGAGRHFCLGASLARLEARVSLGLLAERVALYHIDEASSKRVHSINVRGFARLPTTVVPR